MNPVVAVAIMMRKSRALAIAHAYDRARTSSMREVNQVNAKCSYVHIIIGSPSFLLT